MAWVAGIVVLLLLVFSAGFRKFAGGLVLIAAIAGFGIWQYQEMEEKNSKNRISPSELVFEDVVLKPSYSSYDMVGRLKNNSSKYTLKGVQLKLTFRDCEGESQNNCIIVAEENSYIYESVPPGQARDFKELIYLNSDIKFKGKMVWSYEVDYTQAE